MKDLSMLLVLLLAVELPLNTKILDSSLIKLISQGMAIWYFNTNSDMMNYSVKGSTKQILNFDGVQIETVELAKSLKTGVFPLEDDSDLLRRRILFHLRKM
jgi:hypothetical protein